jgi:hypothetical protein
MPKFLVRTMVFLLVPCLVVDPAIASIASVGADLVSARNFGQAQGLPLRLFAQQAMANREEFVGLPPGKERGSIGKVLEKISVPPAAAPKPSAVHEEGASFVEATAREVGRIVEASKSGMATAADITYLLGLFRNPETSGQEHYREIGEPSLAALENTAKNFPRHFDQIHKIQALKLMTDQDKGISENGLWLWQLWAEHAILQQDDVGLLVGQLADNLPEVARANIATAFHSIAWNMPQLISSEEFALFESAFQKAHTPFKKSGQKDMAAFLETFDVVAESAANPVITRDQLDGLTILFGRHPEAPRDNEEIAQDIPPDIGRLAEKAYVASIGRRWYSLYKNSQFQDLRTLPQLPEAVAPGDVVMADNLAGKTYCAYVSLEGDRFWDVWLHAGAPLWGPEQRSEIDADSFQIVPLATLFPPAAAPMSSKHLIDNNRARRAA